MELLILIGIGVAIYYISNNSASNKEITKEKIVQKFETKDGYVERETVRTFEAKVTDYSRYDLKNTATPPEALRSNTATNQYQQPQQIEKVINPQTERYIPPPTSALPSNFPATTTNTPNLSSVKLCTGCKRVQPFTAFYESSKNPDGLTKWCQHCLEEAGNKDSKGLRKCSNCKQMRKRSSFFKSSKSSDGLSKWCKFCHKDR